MRTLRRLGLAALAGLGALGVARIAPALVNQIDGLVLPASVANCPGSGNPNGCVQVALNLGEGLAATATNNPLNAIFDAAIAPEVFQVPKTNNLFGTVTVRDQVEGAGFENTFGWYNVSDPATLYTIHPCSDEPGAVRSVDFQAEFAAGRYLGGFIGFFLVSPEGAPVANNCGSPTNIGRLYYTESARNGDGNYVHYLLYQSKVDAKRFYFGFEDLFRGGDNDFEDMFVRVDGLVIPCTPSAEICDGKDNNCDGLIDNAPVDAGTDCGATEVGECEFGTKQCQLGALVCVGAKGPAPEQCNGLDDDCDGMVDDAPSGQGAPCGTDVGECMFGQQVCVGGVFVCTGGKGPAAETCNLLDDDCDGTADDSTIEEGGACGSNVGTCLPGVNTCIAGVVVCSGGTGPATEVCNGLDDDCNGAIDDGNPGGGAACGTDVGACELGVEFCVGGTIQCVGGVGPLAELCDGVDNDCDGAADVAAQCPNGSQCVEGFCAAPCGSGEFPCPGSQVCKDGYCLPDPCTNVDCPAGERCEDGACVPSGEGGGMPSGSTSATTSSTTGAGGEAGSTVATTGAGGEGGVAEPQAWGLSTGGGGVRCAVSGAGEMSGARAGWLAVAALAAAVTRKRRRRGAARSVEVSR
jgi:Notch-like protein